LGTLHPHPVHHHGALRLRRLLPVGDLRAPERATEKDRRQRGGPRPHVPLARNDHSPNAAPAGPNRGVSCFRRSLAMLHVFVDDGTRISSPSPSGATSTSISSPGWTSPRRIFSDSGSSR